MKTRLTSRPGSGEERRSAANAQVATQLKGAAAMPDTRTSLLAQLQHQQLANNSSQTAQLKARADTMVGRGADAPVQRVEDEELLQGKFAVAQREEDEELLQGKFATVQRMADEALVQGKFEPVQRMEEELLQGRLESRQTAQLEAMPNNTGMPNQLKAGIESLSGMSMDHVKVHYNSDKPAQLNAHAYAQGSEIHMAPGQERHLPHEAWHVVQQAQGRVQPTMQMKAGVPVNDDASLEHEADLMGAKAAASNVNLTAAAAPANGVGMMQIRQEKAKFAAVSKCEGADAVLQLKKAHMTIGTKDYALGSYPAIKKAFKMELDNDDEVIITHWTKQEVKFKDELEFKSELGKLKLNWEQQKVFYPSDTKAITEQEENSTVRMYSARPLDAIDKLYAWAVSKGIEIEGFDEYIEARVPETKALAAPMKAHFGDSAHTRKHWHQKKTGGKGVGLISIDLNESGATALKEEKANDNIEKGGEGYAEGKIGLKQEKNFYSAAIGENSKTWAALEEQIQRIVLHEWEAGK